MKFVLVLNREVMFRFLVGLILCCGLSAQASEGNGMPSVFRSYCERRLVDQGYFKRTTQAKVMDIDATVVATPGIIFVRQKNKKDFTRFARSERGIIHLTEVEKFYPDRFFSPSEIENKTILDLACGEGTLTEDLRRRGSDAYGLDIALTPYMMSKPYFVRASAERTGFPDKTFDTIYSTQGPLFYQHKDRRLVRAILVEAHRILKTNGVLRISHIPGGEDLREVGGRPEVNLANTIYAHLPSGLRIKSWPDKEWSKEGWTGLYGYVHYWLEIERID